MVNPILSWWTGHWLITQSSLEIPALKSINVCGGGKETPLSCLRLTTVKTDLIISTQISRF